MFDVHGTSFVTVAIIDACDVTHSIKCFGKGNLTWLSNTFVFHLLSSQNSDRMRESVDGLVELQINIDSGLVGTQNRVTCYMALDHNKDEEGV